MVEWGFPEQELEASLGYERRFCLKNKVDMVERATMNLTLI